MVRKRQQVFSKKNLESGSSGLHLRFSIRESLRRGHHIGETPIYFRVAARDCWEQQGFRVLSSTIVRINFCKMYARFHIARQIFNGFSILLRSPARLCFRYALFPQNT